MFLHGTDNELSFSTCIMLRALKSMRRWAYDISFYSHMLEVTARQNLRRWRCRRACMNTSCSSSVPEPPGDVNFIELMNHESSRHSHHDHAQLLHLVAASLMLVRVWTCCAGCAAVLRRVATQISLIMHMLPEQRAQARPISADISASSDRWIRRNWWVDLASRCCMQTRGGPPHRSARARMQSTLQLIDLRTWSPNYSII